MILLLYLVFNILFYFYSYLIFIIIW